MSRLQVKLSDEYGERVGPVSAPVSTPEQAQAKARGILRAASGYRVTLSLDAEGWPMSWALWRKSPKTDPAPLLTGSVSLRKPR